MLVSWNKRVCLRKKRVEVLLDWPVEPTWKSHISLFRYCGGDPIWNGVRGVEINTKGQLFQARDKRVKRERYKSNILKTFFIVVDINECALYPGTCPFPSRCRNTIGGHTCVCPKGFVMDRQKICVGKYTCALHTLNMLQEPKLASRSPTDKSTDGRPVNSG